MTYKKSLFRLRDAEVGRSNRLAPINLSNAYISADTYKDSS